MWVWELSLYPVLNPEPSLQPYLQKVVSVYTCNRLDVAHEVKIPTNSFQKGFANPWINPFGVSIWNRMLFSFNFCSEKLILNSHMPILSGQSFRIVIYNNLKISSGVGRGSVTLPLFSS